MRNDKDASIKENISWPSEEEMSGPGDDRPVPWPWTLKYSVWALKDLIGRKARVSRGPVTQEIVPGRVTVIIDDEDRIVNIYVDPDLPKA